MRELTETNQKLISNCLSTGSSPITDLNRAWVISFYDFLEGSPRTFKTYQCSIRRFLAWLEENHITRPERADIIKYKKSLVNSGYEATTIQTYLTGVRVLFEYLEAYGLYPNIARRIKGEKVSREPKRDYLTSDQAAELLHSIERDSQKGKRAFAIISLCLCCGLRTVEVSRANVKDLRSRNGKTVLYVQGKGRSDRAEYVTVPLEVAQAIRDYLKTRGKPKGMEPLFVSLSNNNLGGRLTTDSISRIIKGAMLDCGMDSDRLTAHSLRHTAATLALESGASLEEVQQSLRHRRPDTTLVYVHCLDRDKNSCSDRVASAVFA